ncbi:hypothetical protein ACIBG4_35605 [Nonomuraea sp. NPDC050383]|uniref:hypothetical protein n=1 Tax=Nonomuraea sp. NPDC050383 TaxID=3364362 RepID=UPI0037ACAC51
MGSLRLRPLLQERGGGVLRSRAGGTGLLGAGRLGARLLAGRLGAGRRGQG